MRIVSIVMMVFGSLWIITLFFEKIVAYFQSVGKNNQSPSVPTFSSEVSTQTSAPTTKDSASFLGVSKTKIHGMSNPNGEPSPTATTSHKMDRTVNESIDQVLAPVVISSNRPQPVPQLADLPTLSDFRPSTSVKEAEQTNDVFPFSEIDMANPLLSDTSPSTFPPMSIHEEGGAASIDVDFHKQEDNGNDEEGDDEFIIPSTMASQLELYGQGRAQADEAEDILLDIEPGGIESYPLDELSDDPQPSFPLEAYQRRIITVRTAALDIAHSIRVRKRRKESIYLIDQFLQVVKHYEMIGDRNVAELVNAVALTQVDDEEDDMALFLRLQRQTSSGVEEAELEPVS